MKLLVTGLCAIAAVVPLAGVATAAPTAPDVPGGIAVGEGYKPYLIGHAVGVQIYDCNGVELEPARPEGQPLRRQRPADRHAFRRPVVAGE